MMFVVKKSDTKCKTDFINLEFTRKKNICKDLVAALYMTEVSTDLCQTDYFREGNAS